MATDLEVEAQSEALPTSYERTKTSTTTARHRLARVRAGGRVRVPRKVAMTRDRHDRVPANESASPTSGIVRVPDLHRRRTQVTRVPDLHCQRTQVTRVLIRSVETQTATRIRTTTSRVEVCAARRRATVHIVYRNSRYNSVYLYRRLIAMISHSASDGGGRKKRGQQS